MDRAPQECAEFYLAVAHHVRVRRAAACVFADEIVNHRGAVLPGKIPGPERNAEMRRHAYRIESVLELLPTHAVGRVIGYSRLMIPGGRPHLDVNPDHVKPALLQERFRNRGINSPAAPDKYRFPRELIP